MRLRQRRSRRPPSAATAKAARCCAPRASASRCESTGSSTKRSTAQVQPIGDFVQMEPVNGAPATEQTELWILFDDDNFYVSGKAHDRSPDRWVLNEMRRDIPNVSLNESVGFSIDTFNDYRNGYLYEVNALGGFLDAQVTNEGMPPNSNWNSVFNVQVGRFEGGWTFEFRVPFWSIRYQPGPNPVWGFNMRRTVRWKNEESHIVPLPLALGQRRGLIQMSLDPRLVGLELPPRAKNLEFRPYGIATTATDRLARPLLVERPDGQRRPGREIRRDAEPDRRPDLPHRLRPGGSGRAAGEPDPLQPALPREADVLPRRPGHLQLRHRRRAERRMAPTCRRSSSAGRSASAATSPCRSSPAAGSPARSAPTRWGRSASRPTTSPSSEPCPPISRRCACGATSCARARSACCSPIVRRRCRPADTAAPTAPTPDSASSTR